MDNCNVSGKAGEDHQSGNMRLLTLKWYVFI